MAKKIQCDGCGKIGDPDGDIRLMEFRPAPGLGQPAAVWKRDLCGPCTQNVEDPLKWPRAKDTT